MIDAINKALDMGWRAVKTAHGSYRLEPPEGEAEPGFHRMIGIPPGLEQWVEARNIPSPDEAKRNSLKHKVITWFNLEWPGYLKECDSDETYAKEIILQDAQSDFSIDEYDAKEWFDARNG